MVGTGYTGRTSADTVIVEADMLRRMVRRVFILCKVGSFSQPGSFGGGMSEGLTMVGLRASGYMYGKDWVEVV